MAASTRSSVMPRRRSWRSTMRSRFWAKALVDVPSKRGGVMYDHLPPTARDQSGTVEGRQEARHAFTRGACQLGDLRAGGADQHVPVVPTVLGELGRLLDQHGRHAAGHGLEGLARDALVRLPQALREGGQELERDIGVLVKK